MAERTTSGVIGEKARQALQWAGLFGHSFAILQWVGPDLEIVGEAETLRQARRIRDKYHGGEGDIYRSDGDSWRLVDQRLGCDAEPTRRETISTAQRQALALLRSFGGSAYVASANVGMATWRALDRKGYVRIVSDGSGCGPKVERA